MAAETNREIILAARPEGPPRESDFALVERPIPTPEPGEHANFVVGNFTANMRVCCMIQ